MPTFGLSEEIEVPPLDGDTYFRYFLGNSTQQLKQKKFTIAHEKELAVYQRKYEDRDLAKRKANQIFEERRKRHRDAFQGSKARIESTDDVVSEVDVANISLGWYNEYEHPSCTANLSSDGILQQESPKKPTSSPLWALSTKSTARHDISFNSTLGSLSDILSDSKPIENTSFSGLKLSTTIVPKGAFNLDNYTGTRPSFGGSLHTSTPYAQKIIPKLDAVVENDKSSVSIEDKENIPSVSHHTEKIQQAQIPTTNETQEMAAPNPPEAKLFDSSASTSESSRQPGLIPFYSQEMDKKEDNDIAKERFERSNGAIRSSIKRTIVEKLSVVAKKYAKPDELLEAAEFFSRLLGGPSVVGANNSSISLADPDAICYARNVLVDHCLGLIERDNTLVVVIANILRRLIEFQPDFETLLVGKLLTASVLLTNDIDKCSKFVTQLSAQPGDLRTFTMNREKSIVQLFCQLHILGKRCGSKVFSPAKLWRMLAHIINSPHCVLSTVLLLYVVLEKCGSVVATFYPNQWPKVVCLIRKKMIPEMEHGLLSFEERRIGGEAVFISLLRDALESF